METIPIGITTPAPEPREEYQPPPMPTSTGKWELVTPALAAQFLACASKQRRQIPSLIEHYGRQMPYQWRENPEPIIINESGEMLEGQHRCKAILRSGFPIWLFVVRGVADDVFPVLNTGRTRRASDVLSIRYKDANPTALSAAAGLLWRYENGALRSTEIKLTPQEVSDFVDHHQRLALCTHGSRDVARMLGPAAAAFCRYLFVGLDPEVAERFFESLERGDRDRGTGARELRERLLINASARHKMNQTEKAAIAIKAWNADRERRTIKLLTWKTKGKEEFPVPK